MTRGERKAAAREALQRLWSRGLKWRAVADALGVEPRVVSQWNAGSVAPNHSQVDQLLELGQPTAIRELVARIGREPRAQDVERVVELLEGEEPVSERQLRAIERALSPQRGLKGSWRPECRN